MLAGYRRGMKLGGLVYIEKGPYAGQVVLKRTLKRTPSFSKISRSKLLPLKLRLQPLQEVYYLHRQILPIILHRQLVLVEAQRLKRKLDEVTIANGTTYIVLMLRKPCWALKTARLILVKFSVSLLTTSRERRTTLSSVG